MTIDTRSITQEVFFNATPNEVFRVFTNEAVHGAMSGGESAKIDTKVGGTFSVLGGAITGIFRAIVPDRKLLQDWRGQDWPKDHHSRLEIRLAPIHDGRGTHLQLMHSGIPADKAEGIGNGWRDYYWLPMAEFFRSSKVGPVRTFLEEFKNHGNIDVVDKTWTKDCVLHVPGFDLPPGRQAQKNVGKAIFDAFSNIHVEVEQTIVEGDRVVERHRATAIHKGEFMGVPATGKKVFWTENHIYLIRDGQIAEAWSEVSFHDLIAQMGGSKDYRLAS